MNTCSRGVRHVVSAAALLLSASCGSAQQPPASTLSPRDRVAIFDTVWSTINTQYYDTTFHGADWKQVRQRYAPRVSAAKDDAAFYTIFEEMLAELRDAHTSFIRPQPNAQSPNAAAPRAARVADAGIDLGEADGNTVITKVAPGSNADSAGIMPGMILRTVNRRPLDSIFAQVRAKFAGSSTGQATRDLLRQALLSGGFLGSNRAFGIERFDGSSVSVVATGRRTTRANQFESHRLDSGIGYIHFTEWQSPVDSLFEHALREMHDAQGIIIDLRGNGGGRTDLKVNIASTLFDKPTPLGGFRDRNGRVETFLTHAVPQPYTGPVVLIVDEVTASASESFTAALADLHRAKVVGRETCGCATNQETKAIKGGGTLRFSAREYASPSGRVIEGVGITPDFVVPLRIDDLRRGRDAALEKAVQLLLTARRRSFRL